MLYDSVWQCVSAMWGSVLRIDGGCFAEQGVYVKNGWYLCPLNPSGGWNNESSDVNFCIVYLFPEVFLSSPLYFLQYIASYFFRPRKILTFNYKFCLQRSVSTAVYICLSKISCLSSSMNCEANFNIPSHEFDYTIFKIIFCISLYDAPTHPRKPRIKFAIKTQTKRVLNTFRLLLASKSKCRCYVACLNALNTCKTPIIHNCLYLEHSSVCVW